MISVSIVGIGGQGSVLAAKILAQAATAKGWQVRSAETTGMAQRGGDVMSHVRMGNAGEEVFSPLPAKGSVDVLIALEPGEGARALSYLKKGGLLVIPRSGVSPTVVDFKAPMYSPQAIIDEVQAAGINAVVIDDVDLCSRLGSRKALNIVMLAATLLAVNKKPECADNALCGALGLDEMREAIEVCVKKDFVALNMKAIDLVERFAKI